VVAEHLGIRVDWVRDWETPSRRRNPTPLQLIALSKLTDVEPQQLTQMLLSRTALYVVDPALCVV
jgi:hypothetical protein